MTATPTPRHSSSPRRRFPLPAFDGSPATHRRGGARRVSTETGLALVLPAVLGLSDGATTTGWTAYIALLLALFAVHVARTVRPRCQPGAPFPVEGEK